MNAAKYSYIRKYNHKAAKVQEHDFYRRNHELPLFFPVLPLSERQALSLKSLSKLLHPIWPHTMQPLDLGFTHPGQPAFVTGCQCSALDKEYCYIAYLASRSGFWVAFGSA